MRIGIFGAGAWGTAVACHAASRHPVRLWARDASLVASLRRDRRNERYLPGITLPPAIEPDGDLDAVCRWLADDASLAVVATPVAGLRATLAALRTRLPADVAGVVRLCKGIESDTGRLPYEIASEESGPHAAAVLSGPSFAQEVAGGLPVALTIASTHDALQRASVEAFHHGAARIYRSADIVGVELGGALKNVMAIAAGICDGLALGQNARAALITRGLAEIARLGAAFGAKPETFMGLTGLGDLVLTCTGDLSRNRRVGLALAAGESLDGIIARLGHVAEGVRCASVAGSLAQAHGVEMPIVAAVNSVLSGESGARDAVLALLAREPRIEHY